MLPQREETLKDCIREGLSRNQWGVAIGDNNSGIYQQLVEKPEELDQLVSLFDGSASLVTGDFLDLVREQLRPAPDEEEPPDPNQEDLRPNDEKRPSEEPVQPVQIPLPPRRLGRVRLNVRDLDLAKTGNLQQYLFRVLQEHDAGARVNVTIQVESDAGIPQETIEQRIVEGFDQLGIELSWEEA